MINSKDLLKPIYPKPAPYQKRFFVRLLKGSRSWLELLSDVDFRIPVGSVQFLGLNIFLVNDPASVKRLLIDDVDVLLHLFHVVNYYLHTIIWGKFYYF